jgi:hypothetical protein
MAIDYQAAQAACRRHKAALTRARKKGPEAVIEAVDRFYAEFDREGWPLPDQWHTWRVAKDDAIYELRRAVW